MKKQKKAGLLLGLALGVLFLVLAFSAIKYAQDRRTVEGSAERMYQRAVDLYDAGNEEKAAIQLALYCAKAPADTDAKLLLASWYAAMGKERYAISIYQEIASMEVIESDAMICLSPSRSTAVIQDHIRSFTWNISNVLYPGDVKVTVTGKNLFSGKYEKKYLGADAPAWRTTQWFDIDSQQGFLTMSGGYNRAVWQFKMASGELLVRGDDSAQYRAAGNNAVTNRITATVEIPQGAVACRVAYADESDTESATLDERIQIEYGRFPTDYQPYRQSVYSLDKLSVGDALRYENGAWSDQNGGRISDMPRIELDKGDSVTLTALVLPVVEIDYTRRPVVTDGVYGVAWDVDDPTILLERTDDAVGLSFNYSNGQEMAGLYPNDFDSIFPWSEIRPCAIDAQGVVTYPDDPAFATDGSAGNIFVEIPKHYVRRQVINGRESIAISGRPRAGFTVDPSFVTEQGEVDHIYVAAYLTSTQDSAAQSVSGAIPTTSLSLAEFRRQITALGQGYGELDLCTLQTIQRLFLVETAVRNSQALWMGNCYLSYFEADPQTSSQYALESAEKSNEIVIAANKLTSRFQVGDAVTISTYEQWYGGRKYDPAFSRIITSIQAQGNQYRIAFSGDPLEITAGETQISHVPSITGETNELAYHSGSWGEDGLSSFQYRYMENIWGSAMIWLDGAYAVGSEITVTYPNKQAVTLAYDLAVQQQRPVAGQEIDYSVMSVQALGYDRENPTIMLPSQVGAPASTFYGDALYTSYEEDWRNQTAYFLYAGTWDLRQSTGLFCYRVMADETDNWRENASRMVYRPAPPNQTEEEITP